MTLRRTEASSIQAVFCPSDGPASRYGHRSVMAGKVERFLVDGAVTMQPIMPASASRTALSIKRKAASPPRGSSVPQGRGPPSIGRSTTSRPGRAWPQPHPGLLKRRQVAVDPDPGALVAPISTMALMAISGPTPAGSPILDADNIAHRIFSVDPSRGETDIFDGARRSRCRQGGSPPSPSSR